MWTIALSLLIGLGLGFGVTELLDYGTDDDDDVPDPIEPETGNDGDDVIYLDQETFFDEDGSYLVEGGAGDDTIGGNVRDSDQFQLDGGAGNDVIDAAEMNNVALIGGDGDDVLYTSAHAPSGNGYGVFSNGGAGDDVLVHNAPPQVWSANVPVLTGGEGQDRFEISFDESYEIYTDDDGNQYTLWDEIPVRSNMVIVSDFDPDQETIQITLDIDDPQYTAATAELEVGPATRVYSDTQPGGPPLPTDEDGEETRIIVTYQSDTGIDREMVIVVKGTGLTWDNITFAGEVQPASLVPTS